MVLNSVAGRLHSLDLSHCVGCLSKELNQGSVYFKSLSPPSKEKGESKDVEATFKKEKIIPGNLGKIMEFCHSGKVGTVVPGPN